MNQIQMLNKMLEEARIFNLQDKIWSKLEFLH